MILFFELLITIVAAGKLLSYAVYLKKEKKLCASVAAIGYAVAVASLFLLTAF